MTYRRFPTSAEALYYAVETLSPVSLNSAALVVGEDRYNGEQSVNSALASSIPLAGSPFSRIPKMMATSASAVDDLVEVHDFSGLFDFTIGVSRKELAHQIWGRGIATFDRRWWPRDPGRCSTAILPQAKKR